MRYQLFYMVAEKIRLLMPYTEIIRIHFLAKLLYLSLTWFLKFSRSFSSSFKTWRIKASPNWGSFGPLILWFVILLPTTVITACSGRSARDQRWSFSGRRRLVYSKYPGHQKRRRSLLNTKEFSKNFLRCSDVSFTRARLQTGSLAFTPMGISAGFANLRLSANDVTAEFIKRKRNLELNCTYICCIRWTFNSSLFVKM